MPVPSDDDEDDVGFTFWQFPPQSACPCPGQAGRAQREFLGCPGAEHCHH